MLADRSDCFFFFFKQKTAYEIVPCDWSSDVCSSDLAAGTDSPWLHAAALDVLGRSRLRHGHGPAARGAFAQVTALSRETVAPQAVAGILGLGQVALAAGSASAAWTLIEEAHAIARAGAAPSL